MSRGWKGGGEGALRKPYGITDGTSSRGQNFDGNTGGNHRKKGNLWRDWRDGGSARGVWTEVKARLERNLNN